jgi:hypothetical protein
VRKGIALAGLIKNYDVFHFYFGGSILAQGRDLPWLRRAGRRVVFHFRGCEIRMRQLELAQRVICACKDCPAPCAPDPEKVALRALVWEHADRVLVATPDLLEWVPGAELVPQAIDLESSVDLGPLEVKKGRYVILHAPSDPIIKGTSYLQTAVSNLQRAGYPVELRLLSGQPHAEVLRALGEADIVVDQLLVGWYGNFSIEAMASGRPVVAYIREDLKQLSGYAPPIASATPDTIERTLAQLLDDSRLRGELGSAGRPYVAQIHEATTIARQLLTIYGEAKR